MTDTPPTPATPLSIKVPAVEFTPATNGVYLVTGAFGALGLEVCVVRRLVLTFRFGAGKQVR